MIAGGRPVFNSLCCLNDWRPDHPARPGTPPMQRDASVRGLAFIRSVVNNRIHKHVGLSLLHASERRRAVPLAIHTIPLNLIGALWLQLALAIEGDLEYRRCPECQNWFFVRPKAREDATTFCSSKCRVRSYRGRKREVLRLAEQGLEPKEIREKVDSEPESITRWVAEAKPPTTGKVPSRRGGKGKAKRAGKGTRTR
jgi:hypothetical protein